MKIVRSPANPLITPRDVTPSRPGMKVECVFNAGVTRWGDEIILLLRVAESVISADPDELIVPLLVKEDGTWRPRTKTFHRHDPRYDFSDPRAITRKADPSDVYLTSLSHLRLARSRDGVEFTLDDAPFIFPDNEYEQFGCEDARITLIDGRYYINYSAVSPYGIATALAVTDDFNQVEKRGIILCPDNRDVCFFPARINGKFQALTRPSPKYFGKPEIWLSESPDMLHWGNHRHLLGSATGEWDALKIGGGAPMLETDRGWLQVYHGVDQQQRYCLGVMLLEKTNPLEILAKSATPLLQPEAEYEVEGFFGNVVFTCGALIEDQQLMIYYGAADECMALAQISLADLWAHLGLA
ncbi:glycosidase [Chimaeribacter arupi]|nr:glycosidase [Chimaeribacter arupi]